MNTAEVCGGGTYHFGSPPSGMSATLWVGPLPHPEEGNMGECGRPGSLGGRGGEGGKEVFTLSVRRRRDDTSSS